MAEEKKSKVFEKKRKKNTSHDDDHLHDINENPTKVLHRTVLGFDQIDLNLSLASSLSVSPPHAQPENHEVLVDAVPNDNSATPVLLEGEPVVDTVSNNNNSIDTVTNNNSTITPSSAGSTSRRGRRSSITWTTGGGSRPPLKTNPVTPPYRWATDKRAVVHSMEYLVSHGITTITGDVQCRKCERCYEIEYDVREKFTELVTFILDEELSHRAPKQWFKPTLPTCRFCGEEESCKPVIAEKKRNINWLFLLLGQLLGCCTLEQLKYFCKHTENHRTGAKDRVLFLSYFTLCKQLDPNGPFDF